MKLHRIAVQNINSLYGKQAVDLDEDLLGASLFLVVGQTGAGKSTLLDAATLALFGATPRLPRPRSTATHHLAADDPRRVMSWGTGECLAEVIFSKHGGDGRVRYRARWSCKRARGKADGRYQEPHRSLEVLDADQETWRLLAGGHRGDDFAPVFTRVLEGMDRAEFERRILLAQGRFAAFVHASAKERAAMLERLTGAERFRKVGLKVRDRHRVAVEEHRDAASRAEGVQVLEAAARQALDQEVQTLTTRLQTARTAAESARGLWTWTAEGRRRAELLEQARLAVATQTDVEKLAAPDMARLAEHQRCVVARERARKLTSDRATRDRFVQQLEGHAVKLEAAAEAAQRADGTLQIQAAELAKVRAAAQALKPEIAHARKLHQDAANALVERQAAETAQQEAASGAEQAQEAVQTAKKHIDAASEAVREAAQACVVAADGETLVPKVAGLQALSRSWQERVDAAGTRCHEADAAKTRASEAAQIAKTKADASAELLATANTADKALAEQARSLAAAGADDDEAPPEEPVPPEVATKLSRQRRKGLQAALQQCHAALALVDKRDALQEGEPCPVCGSLEHPSADDEAGREHDERLRSEAEALETRLALIDTTRDEVDEAREAASKARSVAEAAAGIAKVAQERAAGDEKAAGKARDLAAEAQRVVAQALQNLLAELPLQAGLPDDRDEAFATVESAVAAAEARALAWQAATRARDEAAAMMAAATPAQAAAKTLLAGADKALTVATEDAGKRRQTHEAAAARAKGCLQGRLPDIVEQEAADTVTTAEQAHQAADKTAKAANGALQNLQGIKKGLDEELERAEQARKLAGEALASTLAELGIDAEGLKAATLSPTEETELVERKRELDRAHTRVHTLLKERSDALAEHNAERPEAAPEQPSAEQVEAAAQAHNTAKAALSEVTTRHAEQLALQQQDDKQRKLVQTLAAERDKAEGTKNLWTRLNRLVGERNGHAFRDFAMTLTLQRLVDIANHHMRRLSPRYTLAVERDAAGYSQLGFAIIDAWQADRRRAVTTLSGGETFLTSLALALGLAGLSTSTMPVETLLLDEGFGTLDGDTLDIAMAALGMLQDDGVQVGIISHVEALRAHVPAQVVVATLGDGRSELRVAH